MENFTFLSNGIECHNYMLQKILNARKVIFISSWQIDLTYILDKKNQYSLKDILLQKCNEGVKVYILTSIAPSTICNNNNHEAIKGINNINFNIKILDMINSTKFNYFIKNLHKFDSNIFSFKKCCKRLYHQRYFNVDNIHCMLGGIDMDDDLYCSLKQFNKKKYYWIEYGIIFNPPKEFLNYCIDNFNSGGKSSIKSKYFFGNFYNDNTEYDHVIKLIKQSEKHIFIENQWLHSTNNTKNKIMKEILDKCISNENIKCTLITNNEYIDVCHNYLNNNLKKKIYCKINNYKWNKKLYDSLKFMFNYLRKNNISVSQINNQIKIYTISENILVHAKNIIIDHNYMLYGTSNLHDRSFIKGYDIELSIYLKGPKVKLIEKNILKQYQSLIDNNNLNNSINRIYLTKDLFKKLNKFTITKILFSISIVIFLVLIILCMYNLMYV